MLQHDQATPATAWTLPVIEGLPFRGWAKSVQSVVAETPLTTASGARVDAMPWVQTEIGSSRRQIRLNWQTALKGGVCVYARMDRPQ